MMHKSITHHRIPCTGGYDYDRGYFGPFKVCKQLTYNREKCGNDVSKFRLSSEYLYSRVKWLIMVITQTVTVDSDVLLYYRSKHLLSLCRCSICQRSSGCGQLSAAGHLLHTVDHSTCDDLVAREGCHVLHVAGHSQAHTSPAGW